MDFEVDVVIFFFFFFSFRHGRHYIDNHVPMTCLTHMKRTILSFYLYHIGGVLQTFDSSLRIKKVHKQYTGDSGMCVVLLHFGQGLEHFRGQRPPHPSFT